jgi:hypothetical protein
MVHFMISREVHCTPVNTHHAACSPQSPCFRLGEAALRQGNLKDNIVEPRNVKFPGLFSLFSCFGFAPDVRSPGPKSGNSGTSGSLRAIGRSLSTPNSQPKASPVLRRRVERGSRSGPGPMTLEIHQSSPYRVAAVSFGHWLAGASERTLCDRNRSHASNRRVSLSRRTRRLGISITR